MKKLSIFFLLISPNVFAQFLTSYNSGVSFSCIGVDSNNNIWAGRSNGIYFLNKLANPSATQFQAIAGSSNFNVQALAADGLRNIWAGHNGFGGNTAGGGGVERISIDNPTSLQHYSPDRNAECFVFLARNGLATLNSASLAVDKNNTVWSAHKYHDLTSSPDYILTPGSLSFKPVSSAVFFSKGTYRDYQLNAEPPELPYPAYTCNAPITQTPQSRNVYSVACGKNEVWISVAPYLSKRTLEFFPARILKYKLDGSFTGTSFDFASIGIPAGGFFNGLYVTPGGDVWVTMNAGKGFAVRRKGTWTHVNTGVLSCIFPAGTNVNTNAIWGNKLGQVFIGTDKGIIVYGGAGPVTSNSSYTIYNVATNGLISNQILGGASEKDSIQWIATNNGIMRTTLGGNYPASNDTADYLECNNTVINEIEDQVNQNIAQRADYHSYRVETQICTTAGPNGSNCNAQYIYSLMKQNATLTSPTPFDFPYDNLSTLMLTAANKAVVNAMVYQNVSAWNPASGGGNENGGIKYISQVLSAAYNALNFISLANAKIPLLSEYVDKDRRGHWMQAQKAGNPSTVVPCASYNLYNSPYFINDRLGYDISLDNLFCGNQLHSAIYDQVWMYPNDQDLTITNYTRPGHFLYPGKVVRTIVEECGKVKIVTVGTGLSSCGNDEVGKMNAVGNIIVGSILFKNIDLRLKKAFEAAE